MTEEVVARDAKLVAEEGLRERKKRITHRLISDTATAMFLEHGFDDVKVTEVAAACGVSEKTVYNYFPTKESLLLDREEDMALAIRQAFGPAAPARSPIEAALSVLVGDLDEMRETWNAEGWGAGSGMMLFRRFFDLIDGTPSLRAAQRDMMDRLVRVTAEAMAARAGVSPDDPEPQIAAHAILGLWRIQLQAARRYSDGIHTPEELYAKVAAEVHRAARLIDSGLWSFGAMVQGGNNREQLKAAADAAVSAGRQVATALRQAKAAWRRIQEEMEPGDDLRERHQRGKQVHREQHELRRQFQREVRQRARDAQRPGPRERKREGPDGPPRDGPAKRREG
jgi:AcrR family transcriptional regulator